MAEIKNLSMTDSAVESRGFVLIWGVLMAAKMLPGAVEIRIEDLPERGASGRANAVRAVIHDLGHVDERSAQFWNGEEVVVSAVGFGGRGVTLAESEIVRSEIECEFRPVFPEAAFTRENKMPAIGQIGVEAGFQLGINADFIRENQGLVRTEIHGAVDHSKKEMTFQKDAAGTFVRQCFAVGVAFGFAGEDRDIKNLVGISAPGFFGFDFAVGFADDFVGRGIEEPIRMELVADAAF